MFSTTTPTLVFHRRAVRALPALLVAAALMCSPLVVQAQEATPPVAETMPVQIETVTPEMNISTDGNVIAAPLPPIRVQEPLFLPVVVR